MVQPYSMNKQELEAMLPSCRLLCKTGATASYIPILQQADPLKLGVALALKDGRICTAGDYGDFFSIQSIIKVLIFACCLLDNDIETVTKKVSVEPTSDSFNSIKNLELKNNNKPLNPMINAGAIACMSLVYGTSSKDKVSRILDLIRPMAGRDDIRVDTDIYRSEKLTGYRNRALAYYMQSTGILASEQDVEELLDAYFQACSISVNCVDLARIGFVLACNGTDINNSEILPKQIARVLKATMMMCGMYNESGRVAVRIGLPTKSGVGGGIMSLIPNQMGIGIFGPALNDAGSSVAGLALLEQISRRLDASIF